MKLEEKLAFPCLDNNDYNGQIKVYDEGMTLRDYFAAKFMNGFCSDSQQWKNLMLDSRNSNLYGYDFVASEAYKMADAMLKQREQ